MSVHWLRQHHCGYEIGNAMTYGNTALTMSVELRENARNGESAKAR
jgi:hypothetical protein